MTEPVHAIQDCGTKIDFILGGYTSKLQDLDVGSNQPFKDYMKRCYEYYRVENESSMRVKKMDVSKWIDESWNKVPYAEIGASLQQQQFWSVVVRGVVFVCCFEIRCTQNIVSR